MGWTLLWVECSDGDTIILNVFFCIFKNPDLQLIVTAPKHLWLKSKEFNNRKPVSVLIWFWKEKNEEDPNSKLNHVLVSWYIIHSALRYNEFILFKKICNHFLSWVIEYFLVSYCCNSSHPPPVLHNGSEVGKCAPWCAGQVPSSAATYHHSSQRK